MQFLKQPPSYPWWKIQFSLFLDFRSCFPRGTACQKHQNSWISWILLAQVAADGCQATVRYYFQYTVWDGEVGRRGVEEGGEPWRTLKNLGELWRTSGNLEKREEPRRTDILSRSKSFPPCLHRSSPKFSVENFVYIMKCETSWNIELIKSISGIQERCCRSENFWRTCAVPVWKCMKSNIN